MGSIINPLDQYNSSTGSLINSDASGSLIRENSISSRLSSGSINKRQRRSKTASAEEFYLKNENGGFMGLEPLKLATTPNIRNRFGALDMKALVKQTELDMDNLEQQ